MSYREVWDYSRKQPHDALIQREVDGAFIPFDPDNVDYQEYMEWLSSGNNPNAHDVPYTAPYEQPKQEEETVQVQKASPKF